MRASAEPIFLPYAVCHSNERVREVVEKSRDGKEHLASLPDDGFAGRGKENVGAPTIQVLLEVACERQTIRAEGKLQWLNS